MLGVYVILAMAGNIFPAVFFPETMLMFGSVAVLLAIRFYGTGWGVVTALLAGLHTIALWSHPFVVLILMGEALVVGLLLKRDLNLALADAYFWLFIGLPMYGLFYHLFLKLNLAATGVILLKQALNTCFNITLALSLLRFLHLRRYRKTPLTLWDNWLSVILLSFILPPVLITIFNGKPFVQFFNPSYEMQLQSCCQAMEDNLSKTLVKLQKTGEELTLLATEKGLHNLPPLQTKANALQKELPPGTQIYVTDNNDKIILSSLDHAALINRANPEQDKIIRGDRHYTAGYSEVHTDAVMPEPHLSFNIPVIRNDHYAGAVHVTLNANAILDILQTPDRPSDTTFTVIDHRGRIITSNDQTKRSLGDYFKRATGKYENPRVNSYLWQPEQNRLLPVLHASSPVATAEASASTYFPGRQNPFRLAIESPTNITQAGLHRQYLNSLALMLTPALISLLLGWLLNKRVTAPLNELVAATNNVVGRDSAGEKIFWPQQPGAEVAELTANFRELLAALASKEKLIEQLAAENTKIRNDSGKALDDARALRNWEVFSTSRKLRAEVGQGERMKALLEELEAAEEKYRFLVEKSLVGVYISRGDELLYVNPRFAEILGYPHEELLQGVKLNKLVAKDDWLIVHANQLTQLRNEARNLQYQYQVICKDGTVRHVEVLDSTVNYAGKPTIIGTMLDITDRIKAEETIKHMAYHDQLTGLPNRFVFQDRIFQSFSFAERHKKMVGLLFLDLDRFKAVNDTLGHMAGDQLIKQVSERLQRGLRTCDTISRFGGDEFNILVTEINQESDIEMVAHKILCSMEYPFYIGEQELFVTCSIGIAIYPRDCKDAESLIKKADTALYRAKDMGRNNFQTYNETMGSHALERMAMESSLRHVLERNELRVYYQPQVNLLTGKVVGVEALVRWKNADGEIIQPSTFIPLAEEIGFIAPIGEWVLRTACLQAKAWRQAGYDRLRIGVNVSASQFNMPFFSELIAEIINDAAINPELVNLEITENVVVKNVEEAIVKFQRLHKVGITVAIDDFGIGYSSLSYLKDFPIDQLKMDRAFVRNLPHESGDANIARSIVKMAHDLQMSVIAEGVENEEQLDFLRSLGCDEIQGYIISKPVPAEEVVGFFDQKPA